VSKSVAAEMHLGVQLLAFREQHVVCELGVGVLTRIQQDLGLEVDQEVELVAVRLGVHVVLRDHD